MPTDPIRRAVLAAAVTLAALALYAQVRFIVVHGRLPMGGELWNWILGLG